jgi:FKBP-type peptidyl-prolyl cis-trans isomerase 2
MPSVQLGDRVRVRCRRSGVGMRPQKRKTCDFVAGSDRVLRALSLGVVGMEPGDNKQLTLAAGEAYGAERPELIRRIARDRLPASLRVEVGRRLAAVHRTSGRRRVVRIQEIAGDSILVNGNHPLAGREVQLEVCLVGVWPWGGSGSSPERDSGGET